MVNSFISIMSLYDSILGSKAKLGSPELSSRFCKLGRMCIMFLNNIVPIELNSKVPGKKYFARQLFANRVTRPICCELFSCDLGLIDKFEYALQNNDFSNISAWEINKVCYSVCIAFCSTIDLEKNGDPKIPETFLEYFIGHCFSVKLKTIPKNQLDILNLDRMVTLPTDYIFDLGFNKPKFHVPVKTVTRERGIQIWAQQKILDGVYGRERIWGTMVCLSETKLTKKSWEVVEICSPEQWHLYQTYIIQLKRIYYLDVPEKYKNPAISIPVRVFGDFFKEIDDLSNF